MRVHFPATPGRSHNLYLEFIEAPPPGVQYVLPAAGETGHAGPPSLVERVRASPAFRRAYAPILRSALGGLGVADRLRAATGRRRAWDLYHSLGSVHPYPEPWVVGFESVLDFFGMAMHPRLEIEDKGARRYVLRKLLSPHCKRLLPWTDAARRSVLGTFPEARNELDAKMEVLPLALRSGPRPPARGSSDALRILFVASKNFPEDFVPKGGHLALEAFAEIRKNVPAEMVVRAKVPPRYLALHGGTPGLRVIDGMLTDAEVRTLFEEADVFLFPMCHTPGMVVLEAKRAALPPVVLDVWGNREVVEDGVSGRVVPPQDGVPYLTRTLAPNWSQEPAFVRALESNRGRVVRDLVDATLDLVRGPARRVAMGRAARADVEPGGKFSIERRNERLRRVYDEAVA